MRSIPSEGIRLSTTVPPFPTWHASVGACTIGGSDVRTPPSVPTEAGLWRVDITNDAAGLDETQQRALPNNQLLLAYPNWRSFGHVSTVARGLLRDWAFVSTEDERDTFNSGEADGKGRIAPWQPYRQEIIAVNVITGETQRLAHHRSRSIGSDYYSQPRLSASWDGDVVGFASNFNTPGSVDVYVMPFAPARTLLESSATARAAVKANGPVGDPSRVAVSNSFSVGCERPGLL